LISWNKQSIEKPFGELTGGSKPTAKKLWRNTSGLYMLR